jgi:hypothetical protein
MKRRDLLRTIPLAGILGIAGCGGDGDGDSGGDENNDDLENNDDGQPDRDEDGVPDSEDDYPDDPDRSAGETNQGRIDVNEDEWYQWKLSYEEETHIEYEMLVRKGPSIDVVLFSEEEYTHYENDERAQYYSNLSDLDTIDGTASGWVETGDYRLVIDNTNWGEAVPPTNLDDDVAEVEYTITASR